MSGRGTDVPAPGAQEPLHEQMRQRRLASGLDLESLSRETKIHLRYFQAIEQGQVHLLPQGVYMRNFIRIYLRALGMDNPAELQHAIDTMTSGVLRLPAAAVPGGGSPRQQVPQAIAPTALLVGAAIVLLAAGWAVWYFFLRPQPSSDLTPTASPSSAVTPAPVPPQSHGLRPTQPMLPTSTPEPSGVGLTLHAIRKATLTLKGRSGSETPMTLAKNETAEVYLGEPTTIVVSSAGAVEMSLQDRSVPGSRLRASRTIFIDPANIEPLFEEVPEATAAPTTPRPRPARTRTPEKTPAGDAEPDRPPATKAPKTSATKPPPARPRVADEESP